MFLLIVCQGAAAFSVLLIYRALGFRLVRAAPSKGDQDRFPAA
jgi:hypothetical protein